MMRVLVLIAVAGFLAGVVALAGAAALGGPELASRNWEWVIGPHEKLKQLDRDDDHSERADGDNSETTREMAWDGSSKAVFDIPATIEYTQGPEAKLVIRGPRSVVERVKLRDGRLTLDQPLLADERLHVMMTAPGVNHFEVGGDDHLEIRGYKQDGITIVASGSSEVIAEGEARAVDLELSGSGEADLGDLPIEVAKADISGAAKATLSPRDLADLEVSGSGSVTLKTRPKHLETDVAGAGEVVFDDGTRASDTDTPAPPRNRVARDT